MTGWEQVKKVLDEMDGAFKVFRESYDEKMDDVIERIETLESSKANPGRIATPGGADDDPKAREHAALFAKWLRNPKDASLSEKLLNAEAEIKNVNITSDPAGGYAVPQIIASEIERMEIELSPVRDLVRVVNAQTSDYKHLVSIRGANSGWVGEQGTRSETETPELREIAPTMGEIYAYPQCSNWSLEDIFFNVAAWLSEEVAQEFAVKEAAAVVSGNGTNKPTGMLNTTPVLTSDFASPLRAAGAYQYLASDTDASPAAAGIDADTLIDLVFTVNAMYRARASWAMNSKTAGAIRKLKDSDGNYLWATGLQAGQPNLLLGYPVRIIEAMPDIADQAFPVAFGDFRRGYLMTDRSSLRITRDEVTAPGFTKFYIRRRVGGHPLNNDAVKFLRTVA